MAPWEGRKFLSSVFHITFMRPTGNLLCSVSKQRLAISVLSVSDYAIGYLDFNLVRGGG